MKLSDLPLIILGAMLSGCAGMLSGCATDSANKPTEALDESTGVTVASMESPIELVRDPGVTAAAADRRPSFAYLGPIEWDRMGDISYGLWVHVAPGNDQKVGNIRDPGALSIELDDGELTLTPMDPPSVGREPYKAVASWGQTAYFSLDAARLKRLAASGKLQLAVRGDTGAPALFLPTHDTHGTLTRYAISRGVTGD